MNLINKYYENRPPVRPNYWVLAVKKLMLKNQYRKHSIFMMRSRSKNPKASNAEDTTKRKSNSPKKIEDIFTSTFYKKLDETKSLLSKF